MASDMSTGVGHAPRPKLSVRVVAALRAELLAGRFPPGQKLPTENQLTES